MEHLGPPRSQDPGARDARRPNAAFAVAIPVFLVAVLAVAALPLSLEIHAENWFGGGCGLGRRSPAIPDAIVLAGWLGLEALAAALRRGDCQPWRLGPVLRIVRATLAGAFLLACSGDWLQLQLEQAGWLRYGEWVPPR